MAFPLFDTSYKRLYDDAPGLDTIVAKRQPDLTAQSQQSVNRGTKERIWCDMLGLIGIYVLVFLFYMILRPPVIYFRLDDPNLMYPLVSSKVSSVLVALLSLFLPLGVILLFHLLFAWNKWDLIAALYGTLLAYGLALLVTSALWYFVGGLRPYFLTTCSPNMSKVSSTTLYYSTDVCLNGTQFTRDTFHGFPSGHASTAFAGCIFLSSYLAAHLRLYRNGNTLKLFVTLLPLICALWLSTSRITDHHHSPLQVLVGAIIGIISALFAYKLVYLEGFWLGCGRWAHIPYLHYGNI